MISMFQSLSHLHWPVEFNYQSPAAGNSGGGFFYEEDIMILDQIPQIECPNCNRKISRAGFEVDGFDAVCDVCTERYDTGGKEVQLGQVLK